MSSFLCKIIKAFQGHEWEQTYAIISNGNSEPGFAEADWDSMRGVIDAITDSNTDPASGSFAGLNSMIAALIGYERKLHFAPVQFVRLFVWDGVENETEASTFFTTPLSFAGLRPAPSGDENQIAPGNVTWMVSKQPLDFGRRAGRASYRMCLTDDMVKAGGSRLLDWTSSGYAAAQAAVLSGAIEDSNLDAYFGAAVGAADCVLAIPHYIATGTFKGSLLSASPITGIVSKYPHSRQVNKGRKRPAA